MANKAGWSRIYPKEERRAFLLFLNMDTSSKALMISIKWINQMNQERDFTALRERTSFIDVVVMGCCWVFVTVKFSFSSWSYHKNTFLWSSGTVTQAAFECYLNDEVGTVCAVRHLPLFWFRCRIVWCSLVTFPKDISDRVTSGAMSDDHFGGVPGMSRCSWAAGCWLCFFANQNVPRLCLR